MCSSVRSVGANGIATFLFLMDAAPVVTSGAVINAQVWARDPVGADGVLLSDGLEVTVCP